MSVVKSILSGTLLATVLAGSALAADLGAMPDLPTPPVIPDIPTLGSGWYLRGDVSYSHANDPGMQVSRNGIRDNYVSSKLENAPTFGIGVGYRFSSWLRADVTLDYRNKSKLSGVYSSDTALRDPSIGREETKAQFSAITGLFNVYADLGTWSGFTPYVGAGIGASQVRMSNYSGTYYIAPSYPGYGSVCGYAVTAPAVESCASPSLFGSKSRTNFAWALMAGTAIEIGGGVSLDLGYRYLNMGKAQTGYDPVSAPARNKLVTKTVDVHEFRVGLRWALGGPEFHETSPSALVRRY